MKACRQKDVPQALDADVFEEFVIEIDREAAIEAAEFFDKVDAVHAGDALYQTFKRFVHVLWSYWNPTIHIGPRACELWQDAIFFLIVTGTCVQTISIINLTSL